MASSIGSSVVWPNYSTTNVQKAATKSNELGKDQFLSILVAQLRNQDPMQPMNDTEFIAQMAQFTSVEQLMNMAGELALIRQNIGTASSLIGKTVTWNEYDDTGKVVQKSGVVESIISQDGLLYVEVDGKKVGVDFIGQISTKPPGTDETETETDVDTDNGSETDADSDGASSSEEVTE